MLLGELKTTSKVIQYLLAVSVLGVVFISPNYSLGAVLYQQTVSDTKDNVIMGTGSARPQVIGTGLSGTIDEIELAIYVSGQYLGYWRSAQILIACFDNSADFVSNPNSPSCGGSGLSSSVTLNQTGKGFYDFDINYTLNSSKYYVIYFYPSGASYVDMKLYGSTNANSYTGGEYDRGTANIKDVYFKIKDSQPSTTDPGVFITEPVNGSTIGYLNYFTIIANTDNPYASLYSDRKIVVEYGTNQTTPEFILSHERQWTTSSMSVTFDILGEDLAEDTYYAKAYFYIHNQLQASSSWTTFTIDNSLGGLASSNPYDFWGNNTATRPRTASESFNNNWCASSVATTCNYAFPRASSSFLDVSIVPN